MKIITAKDVVAVMLNTPFKAREGSRFAKEWARGRTCYINEISEGGQVSVSFDKPKRVGGGDFAWVRMDDLIEFTGD